jgi:hypothetical protein
MIAMAPNFDGIEDFQDGDCPEESEPAAPQEARFDELSDLPDVPAWGIDLAIPLNVTMRDSEFPERITSTGEIVSPDELGIVIGLENAIREMIEQTGIVDLVSSS